MAFQKVNEGVEAVTAKTTAKSSSDELIARGQAILSSMTAEEKEVIASKSNTLEFVGLLGAQKYPQAKTGAGKVRSASYKPVGIKIKVTEETVIPQIPVTKTRFQDGIDPSEISYITVQAGETVVLSLFEFMYLVARPEYSGYITVNGDAKGGVLRINSSKYKDGITKIPSPSFNYTYGGTPKDSMTPIDEKDENGIWRPLPEYAEKFGALYETSRRARANKASKADTSIAMTAALRNILGIN